MKQVCWSGLCYFTQQQQNQCYILDFGEATEHVDENYQRFEHPLFCLVNYQNFKNR